MSTIYSFFGGSHSASSCLVVDGKIHTIIEEERLTRVKSGDNFNSFPDLSSLKIEEITGIKISEADYRIVVSPCPDAYFRKLLKSNFEKCSHHDAHNYGTYFISGFEGKSLSISYDGGGENSVLKVFLCEDGKMVQVLDGKLHTYSSLAHLWGLSTHLMLYGQEELGTWSMCKDEGKLVGMAPEGRYVEDIYRILQSLISYDNLCFAGGPTNWRTRFVMREMAKLGYFKTQEKREIFSYNLQKFTEDLFIKFLNDLHKLYPEYNKICLSGGLFANVKLNKKINELDWVEEIFIHPAMGDEGLPLGAALKKAFELGEISKPKRIQNVFFGLEYSDSEIERISNGYKLQRYNYKVDDIANKINDGKVIGWFKGRFEYGPRSLGARSILVRPTDEKTHKMLNERLGRHDSMPFAPAVLTDYFDTIYNSTKSKYAAEFMTICYDTKEEWVEKIPSVIQKTDKTSRPQIVTKTSNIELYNLLQSYFNVSGIPLILNTSFNSHNEPIIDNPKQAFDALNKGIIDELVIGNYVYRNN